MKKLSWTKVLNISIILATLLVLGCFFGTAFFKQPVNETQAEALIEGIPFRVGIVNRNAGAFVDGNFTYSTAEEFYNGDLETINDGDYVMLYNYAAEKNFATNATSLQQVKNIYISFGQKNEPLYIYWLNVTVKHNGKTLTAAEGINNKVEYDDAAAELPTNQTLAYYWFDYFDAKPLTSDKNQSGEGLYTFQFDYSYIDANGKPQANKTYVFSFYLLDQARYNTYPQFEHATEGNLDATNIKQFYYNYTTNNLSKLNFDAARYNITYTREKNKDTDTITSSFNIDPNTGLGSITYTKVSKQSGSTQTITTTETISDIVGNAKGEYFTSIYFDELGTYSFTIKYMLRLTEGNVSTFETIENIMAYDVDEPKYEQGLIAKGQYKLHVFGIKLYFSKNGGSELKQKQGNEVLVQADVTNQLYSINDSYDYISHGFKNADNFTIPGVDPNPDTTVANPLKTFTNYPVTNLAPLYFDYYSTFSYSGSRPLSTFKIYEDDSFSTVKQSGYITKDTNLDESGYYEVIIHYTFDRYSNQALSQAQSAEFIHKQAFIFRIDNSTPEITMYKSATQTPENVIKNNSFINTGVTANWQDGTYFQAPIRAEYIRYGFNGEFIDSNSYTKGELIGNGENGKYYIRLYYSLSQDVYVETSFTVDKTPISDIAIQPIYQRKDGNGTPTGYGLVTDINEVNFNNSSIINQPFTLTYSAKASGAPITTTYYKIPFAYNSNAGNALLSNSIIETDYIIDPDNMSSGVDYSLDYASIMSGIISTENAFVENKSYIYVFEISDEAGNKATKYIIYDLTKPFIIVDSDAETDGVQPIENPYNIVNKKATLTWGNYKGVKVDAEIENDIIKNSKLQHVITNETSLFRKIDEQYFLCVPIRKFVANQGPERPLELSGGSFQSSVTLYPLKDGLTNQVDLFFAGDEKVYTYTVTDASHITSATNIAKSNIAGNYIEMFLDNAQGRAYGVFGQVAENSVGNYLTNKTTSAKQLRFTYIPGEEGSDYYVQSVNYWFYDYAPQSYETVDSALSGGKTYYTEYKEHIQNGIPYPTFPFSKNPTIINQPVTLSADKIPDQETRVVSTILNPISGEGSVTYSKPGMYVIRREYAAGGSEESYKYDSVVRYYVYYVDRNGIIDIDSNIEDKHVYQETRSDMLYETGSGILFNFSKTNQMGQYDTYYTALQIQQYLAYAGSTIYDSNKLPINFYLPLDKYNSRVTVNKATDGVLDSLKYLNQISSDNAFNFKLRYRIFHSLNGKETTVYDNTGLEEIINKNFVTIYNNDGYKSLKFVEEGEYTVRLYDNSDNRGDLLSGKITAPIENQYNNSYEFSFIVSHESPNGEYLTKYNDANRTEQLLNITSTTPENLKFNSLNNDSLRFRFRKNDDKYRAEIDPLAIRVDKTVGNSTTNIFSGGSNNNILQFVPDYIDADGPSSTGYYVLTIFDEQDYQNDGKTYLGGTGPNRDYLQAKSQNITYTITLQYVGDAADYTVLLDEGDPATTEDDVYVNYFTRTFTITLDRIKPQYNYQSLISLDNQKFAMSTDPNPSRMDNYFFAVNNNFKFIQNQALGGALDSSALFVRRLTGKNADCDYPEYYKTFTPDDEIYYLEGNTNHIRFSESNSAFEQVSYGGGEGEPINANIAFRQGRGYYEVVERDEAGNYQVYAIYYNPDPINDHNIITYSYNPALSDVDNVQLEIPQMFAGQPQNEVELLGTDLRFIDIPYLGNAKNDYFYKCTIESSALATTKTITNNPNDRNNDFNNWAPFLQLLNEGLEFTKTDIAAGYRVTITFHNRLAENYVITYRVPGSPLKLLPPISESSTEFKVRIPADTDSTYIKEFHVWKFTNGVWVEQSQDLNGNTIVKSYSTGASLQGREYTFGLGEFRFQLIDIFGRVTEEYKGVGVNDANSILFNGSSVVFDSEVTNVDGSKGANVTHTANNVLVQYQTNLYSFVVKQRGVDGSLNKIEPTDYAANGITEQSIVDGVRTLVFQNTEKNTVKQFQVILTVDKLTGTPGYTPTQYNFAINKTLPEIILRNISGGSLITSKNSKEPTVHTENFTISWSNTQVFIASVNLVRTYIDASGKQITENINNIANGYEVGLSGTYTASISNNLGYSDPGYNIYFKLVSGEIVVYDVVAINNGMETILRPSPKTSTITIGETEKVLYRYYALESYNQPQGSEKYIELRANKNKGIEYKLISETTPDAEPEPAAEGEEGEGEGDGTHTLIKRVYQIYGSSNYGYERYIEIIYADELANNSIESFTNIQATYPTDNQGNFLPLTLDGGIVTTNVSQVDLNWKAYNLGAYNYTDLRGNLIYLDYYFNDSFVRTIYSDIEELNKLTIKTAGIHKFKLYDLAGNRQQFGLNGELVINLVNNVLFEVNGAEPVNNQIFNSDVTLEITNRYLYFTDPTITATLNGKEITPERVGTSFYAYRFSGHGYYEVVISTKITQNESVTTKYCFTIINPKIALPCFSVPQNSNFKIIKVLKQNADITHTITNNKELWISPATLGVGNYTVTLSQFNDVLNEDIEFSFQVWINNEIPYIYSSQEFGTSTTKDITITYNPQIIFSQVGESYIAITGEPVIHINSDSPNVISTVNLTQNREYWIQIYSADHKLINSYKVTKDEPLNTTAIILIVVGSVIVVALIVVFIVIRRHLKFR